MTATATYPDQIGGVIISPTSGDNEYGYVISAVTDHQAGTVLYTLDAFQGAEIYRRNMPDTQDYRAQALHDMKEEVQALHPAAFCSLHMDDRD